MEHTVVGVYDSYAQAESAVNELVANGFSRNKIRLSPAEDTLEARQAVLRGGGVAGRPAESGVGHFFRALFGMEKNQGGDIYAEAIRRGSCILAVDVENEGERDEAFDVMHRHSPVDIDERAAHWRSQGWTAYDQSAPLYSQSDIQHEHGAYAQRAAVQSTLPESEQTAIPVIQEELRVGKRTVERGGLRVYQRVTEQPVHEQIQLREEHVNVERHPVDRPATEADLAAFKEGSLELHEMAEEPVVSKTARVVEEVVVGKQVTEQTASIDDTVRKTDVQVEQLSENDDIDFRRHWQTSYAQQGGRYEDYAEAYRYGSSLAGNERYRPYRWSDVEPDIQHDWEASHPGSAWERVKEAVRYGRERISGH